MLRDRVETKMNHSGLDVINKTLLHVCLWDQGTYKEAIQHKAEYSICLETLQSAVLFIGGDMSF